MKSLAFCATDNVCKKHGLSLVMLASLLVIAGCGGSSAVDPRGAAAESAESVASQSFGGGAMPASKQAGERMAATETLANTNSQLDATNLTATSALVDGAVVQLANACSGKVLDVPAADQNNGIQTIVWSDNDGTNQQWRIKADVSGDINLTAVHSGKLLDAMGQHNGAPVAQNIAGGSSSQRWRVSAHGTTVKLVSLHAPAMALDVNGASTSNGAKVQLWQDNGTCAQRWTVLKVAEAVPAPAQAARPPQFLNAGFEEGFQDWKTNGATIETTTSTGGLKAARVSGEPGWWWGGVYRTLVGLEPNTQYVLKAYARMGSGKAGTVYVKNHGGASLSTVISSAGYTLHSVTFTTGRDHTSAEIGAGIDSGSPSDYFFVDNFQLERVSPATTYQPLNTLDTVIDDVTLLTDDAKPHGVPTSYSWYNPVRYKAFYTKTTNYPLSTSPAHTWNALTAWGQLYEAASPSGTKLNTATNTRVQLKDIRTFYLSKKDGKWHLMQASKDVQGSAYREDFKDDVSVTPNLRKEIDGSISVIPGGGYNFHFWPSDGRAVFSDVSDVAALFVTVKARLTTDNSTAAPDFDRAAFVMDMGADIWYDKDAEWDYWQTNGDLGMSRFKRVTPTWQSFNMYAITSVWDHKLTPAIIRGNPPVLE